MPKRIVKTEPDSSGVGQTVTFDDGSTEYDAFGTASVDPDPSAAADPDRDVQSPQVTEYLKPGPVVEYDAMGMPIPGEGEQPDAAGATDLGNISDSVRGALELPPRQTAAPAAPSKPIELVPGAADVVQQPPEQPAPLAFGVRPGSAGGMQTVGKQVKGYAPEDQAKLAEGAGIVAETGRDAANAAATGQDELVSSLETQALNQYLKAETAALANAADQKRNQMVQNNIRAKMEDVAKFRPNRTELFEGTAGGFRALLAGIGMIAGGALAGINGGPNYAADAVFKMIGDNVKDQVAQNSAIYQNLVAKLGDEQAAAEVLRAKHTEAVIEMTKAQELTTKTKEMRAALAGVRERAQLEYQQSLLKAQEALTPTETLAMAYRAPTPASVFVIDRDQQALEQLGVKPDQAKEFMKEKISGQQNAKTVGEAVQYMKELDQDAATLRAIAAANDGVLPGKDQIISPTQNATMRAALAKLGIDHDVAASEAYKIINGLIMRRAKSYGGAITESDLKAAEGEVGVTSGQVLDFMGRMRNEANGQLRAQAYGYFQGRAQPVLDILTHGVGSMQGFRQDKGRPR